MHPVMALEQDLHGMDEAAVTAPAPTAPNVRMLILLKDNVAEKQADRGRQRCRFCTWG